MELKGRFSSPYTDEWSTEQLPQQRHRDWLHPAQSHTVQHRRVAAQSGPESLDPFTTDRTYVTSTETAASDATGIPVRWVGLSGFPRRATAMILESFHAVGTIELMRETPEGINLRYSNRNGLHRAMQLDGQSICQYHVVVKPLLGDPQWMDPIVYPKKPQFPYMHKSRVQDFVVSSGWKGKMRSFGYVFFSWFIFFMWCVMSLGKVQSWCHKHIPLNR